MRNNKNRQNFPSFSDRKNDGSFVLLGNISHLDALLITLLTVYADSLNLRKLVVTFFYKLHIMFFG